METAGYWMKNSGARPAFIRNYEIFETGRRRTLNHEFLSYTRHLRCLTDQYPHLFTLPQYHNDNTVRYAGSRKRPSTDTILQASGKRPFSRTETNLVPKLNGKRKKYLDDIFKSIVLEKADKRASKRLVDQILKATMSRLVSYNGGQIYSRQYIDAGSYPVKMKISKADEFDVNIPLNITAKRVRTLGKVSYRFDKINQNRYRVSSLTVDPQLVYDPEGMAIPPGYAVADVEMECYPFYPRIILERRSLPRKFLHSNLQKPRQNTGQFNRYRSLKEQMLFYQTMMGSNESIRLHGCVELIPLDVKKDLFEKMTAALARIAALYFIRNQREL